MKNTWFMKLVKNFCQERDQNITTKNVKIPYLQVIPILIFMNVSVSWADVTDNYKLAGLKQQK